MLNNVLIRLIKQPKKYVIIHLLLFKVSSYLPRFIIDTLLGQTNAFNLGLSKNNQNLKKENYKKLSIYTDGIVKFAKTKTYCFLKYK